MAWNYNREESTGFEIIPEGDHRIKIKEAEKTVSKTGNEMLKLTFNVSGYTAQLYHYIVFLEDKPEITNRNLTQFFDSFTGIPDGEFDTKKWIGKVGAAHIIHDEYKGNPTAKIQYFIPSAKQGGLKPYIDKDNKSNLAVNTNVPDGFSVDNNDDDLPF